MKITVTTSDGSIMLVSVGNAGNENDLIIGNIPPVIAVAENIIHSVSCFESTQRFVLAFLPLNS